MPLYLLSCSRVIEEPTPVNAEFRSNAKSNVESHIRCPAEPDPIKAANLFVHGKASFKPLHRDEVTLHVEIARSPDAQEHGMMYRTHAADDFAMVFEFSEPHHAVFWMRNTCIALDMIFVGEDHRVLGVVTAPPLNEHPRHVPGISKYVVEMKAGRAAALNIGKGTLFVPPT